MKHKHIHPDILRRIEEQEKQGGVRLDKMEVGTIIEAKTRNSTYVIEVLDNGKFMVQGGLHFTEKQEMFIAGSTFGGSMLKLTWLGVGMCIEFPRLTTTFVKSLQITGPDGAWTYEISNNS